MLAGGCGVLIVASPRGVLQRAEPGIVQFALIYNKTEPNVSFCLSANLLFERSARIFAFIIVRRRVNDRQGERDGEI